MKRVILILFSLLPFTFFSCSNKTQFNGVVFRQAIGSDVSSIDPHIMEDNSSYTIGLNSFEGLFRMNAKSAEPEPALISSYTLSPNGLCYTFILKDNITFSDGVPITAQTIVDSWRRALIPETASPTAYVLAELLINGEAVNKGSLPAEELGVKALNEKTLEVKLAFPSPYARDVFSLPVAVALPMHIIKEKGEGWNKSFPIVSNGPFVISSWKPSSQIVLEKNLAYYDSDKVGIDRIITYTTDDMHTAYNMYLNGELDYITCIPPDKIEEAQLRDDYHSHAYSNGYYYLYNTKRKPLDDLRVRKALAISIDRKVLTEKILRGNELPLYAVIYSATNYPSKQYFTENIREAQDLLAQAGYPDGKGFPNLTLSYNTLESNKRVAEFIQQQWKRNLGISINLQNQEWKTFLSTRMNFDYDILRLSWLPDYPDPMGMLCFFMKEAGYSTYCDKHYDEMLKATNYITNVKERMQALAAAEAKIMHDLPFIPLFSQPKNALYDGNCWKGIFINPANICMLRSVSLIR